MYENVLWCVRIVQDNNDLSESPVDVKHGCWLSPTLFCMFINEVAEELKRDGKRDIILYNRIEEIFSLLFAGDIALILHTAIGLHYQFNILARASKRIRLSLL